MPLPKEIPISPQVYSLSKKLKIIGELLLFVLIYGTLGHMLIFGLAPFDAFAMTLSTIAFHYEEAPTIIGEAFQVSILLVGAIAFWWVIWTTFDMTIEGKFKQYFSEVKTMSDITKLQNHYIICGSGRVGLHVAKLLALEKKPFVMIDVHEEDAEAGKKRGFLSIKGDPFDEETLIKCGITRAHGFVAVMGETEKNILATLMAREFNPKLKIYARTEKEEFVRTLKKVGADHVIMPEAAGALDIVRAIGRDDKEFKELQAIKTKVGKETIVGGPVTDRIWQRSKL